MSRTKLEEEKLLREALRPDIMVLGTGRSGTSFIAEVLHEHFKVCMGHDFIPKNTGSYECQDMRQPTVDIVGGWGFKPLDEDTELWLLQYRRTHLNCKADLRGIKLTNLAWLTPRQLIEIRPRLVIRTWRRNIDSARSYQNLSKGNAPLKHYTKVCREREENLVKLQLATTGRVNFVWVDIPNKSQPRMAREDLITYLSPYINRLRN